MSYQAFLFYSNYDDEWEISRDYTFETSQEAAAFVKGMNEGLEKGRCDSYRAVTFDQAKELIGNDKIFIYQLDERISRLGISEILEYRNEDKTAFNIPDYVLSNILRTIEDKAAGGQDGTKSK